MSPVLVVFVGSFSVFYVFAEFCLPAEIKSQSRMKNQMIFIPVRNEVSKNNVEPDSSFQSSLSRLLPPYNNMLSKNNNNYEYNNSQYNKTRFPRLLT